MSCGKTTKPASSPGGNKPREPAGKIKAWPVPIPPCTSLTATQDAEPFGSAEHAQQSQSPKHGLTPEEER